MSNRPRRQGVQSATARRLNREQLGDSDGGDSDDDSLGDDDGPSEGTRSATGSSSAARTSNVGPSDAPIHVFPHATLGVTLDAGLGGIRTAAGSDK